MGWFSKGDRREPDSAAAPAADGAADGMPDDDALPGRPRWRALSEEQRAALDTDLAALRAAGVERAARFHWDRTAEATRAVLEAHG